MSSEVPAPLVAGILQARTGSTRLPGKVLMQLGGKTILAHCIDRMRESGVLDRIVVATTERSRDDAVCEEAGRCGALCYRGPEDDVLKRYAGAAAGAGFIVRVTADNPLTDPASLTRCVKELIEGGWDYVAEEGLPYGAASEAFTIEVLEELDRRCTEPRHREHVTLALRENPGCWRLRILDAPAARRAPEIRVTVDTLDDLLRLRELLCRGSLSFAPFSMVNFLFSARMVQCDQEMAGVGSLWMGDAARARED